MRLTRYWFRQPAGAVGTERGRVARGGVLMARVEFAADTVLVPVEYTEVLS